MTRWLLATVLATIGVTQVVGCGAKEVTDTIYFRPSAPRSAEGQLISSVLTDSRNPPPAAVQHYQLRGMVPQDSGSPRVIVTFKSGTTRTEVDTFNRQFIASGLVDHVSVAS